MSKTKKVFGFLTMLVLVLAGIFLIYTNDDYDANDQALAAIESDKTVKVTGVDPLYFSPIDQAEAQTGIIFYPGGKVAYESYAPLMRELAEEGYAAFLVDVPFGLAVFDIKAAKDVMADHPEISKWYVAGHSLGGSMAAIYAAEAHEQLAGLILLASYSTADLSETALNVLSIYGSEDAVLNSESVEKNRSLLPGNHKEIIIEGGNHAQFGNYGEQAGDGEATISANEQQHATVEAITNLLDE